MIGTHVLSRVSRKSAPVMQYGQYFPGNAQNGRYGQGIAYGPAPMGQGIARPPTETASPIVLIQGETLRTWDIKSPAVEQVLVDLSTEGRPLDANIEVWNAAGNTPVQIRAYSEDGGLRPITTVLATPRGPSTVAVRNIGKMEFPLTAQVDHEYVEPPSPEHPEMAQNLQGGALRTYPMDPTIEAVEVLIHSRLGNPMNARIEILQGPDTNKEVIEVYSDNGLDRPFFCTFATPSSGNVIRILNTGPVEYPVTASVVPIEPRGRYLQNREPSLD
jgi:hypothetical protein